MKDVPEEWIAIAREAFHCAMPFPASVGDGFDVRVRATVRAIVPIIEQRTRNLCVDEFAALRAHVEALETELVAAKAGTRRDALRAALIDILAREYTHYDWTGVCPYRPNGARCRGGDGRSSAFGPATPIPHNDDCPFAIARRALEQKP